MQKHVGKNKCQDIQNMKKLKFNSLEKYLNIQNKSTLYIDTVKHNKIIWVFLKKLKKPRIIVQSIEWKFDLLLVNLIIRIILMETHLKKI